jgi:hypothetical protein
MITDGGKLSQHGNPGSDGLSPEVESHLSDSGATIISVDDVCATQTLVGVVGPLVESNLVMLSVANDQVIQIVARAPFASCDLVVYDAAAKKEVAVLNSVATLGAWHEPVAEHNGH